MGLTKPKYLVLFVHISWKIEKALAGYLGNRNLYECIVYSHYQGPEVQLDQKKDESETLWIHVLGHSFVRGSPVLRWNALKLVSIEMIIVPGY